MKTSFKDFVRRYAPKLPSPLVKVFRYYKEHAYVTGRTRVAPPKPSVVFFTVHKSASTFMGHLLSDINRQHLHLVSLDLAAYFWDVRTEPFYNYANTNAEILIRDTGFLYAPLREYVSIPHLKRARILAMLRDPRDKIVSGYYSAGRTHRAPGSAVRRARFLSHRKAINDISIDEYALQQVSRVSRIYKQYRCCIARERVVTYEEMWRDFDNWAKRLGELLEIRLSDEEIRRYRRMARVDECRAEDEYSHRRKGIPGDFEDKLAPKTIKRLNEVFAEDLYWLYGEIP